MWIYIEGKQILHNVSSIWYFSTESVEILLLKKKQSNPPPKKKERKEKMPWLFHQGFLLEGPVVSDTYEIKQTSKPIVCNYSEHPVLQGTSISTVLIYRCVNCLKKKHVLGKQRKKKKLRAWHLRYTIELNLKINTGLGLEEGSEVWISGKAHSLEQGFRWRTPLCMERAGRRVAINEIKYLGLSKILIKVKPNHCFNNVEPLLKIMIIPHFHRKNNPKPFTVACRVQQCLTSTHGFRLIIHSFFISNLLASHRSHLNLDLSSVIPSTI